MNEQCPRCLSSMFPRVGHACEFCNGYDVHQQFVSRHHMGIRIGEPVPTESEAGNEQRTWVASAKGQQNLQLYKS